MKILIVDDSEKIRTALRNIIKTKIEASYETKEAVNGLEALEMVSTFKPDILLTDILMPKMDGLQLSSIIKSQTATKGIFIAAITGLSGDEQIQKIYASGIDFYIAKPFQLEDIVARLKVITALIGKQPVAYESSWVVYNAYVNKNIKHYYLTFLIEQEADLFLIFDAFENHKYFSQAIILKDLMVLLIKSYRHSKGETKQFKIILEESNDSVYLTFNEPEMIEALQKNMKPFSQMFGSQTQEGLLSLSLSINSLLTLKHQHTDTATKAPEYTYELFSAKELISISSEDLQGYLKDVQEASSEFTKLYEGATAFNEVMKFSFKELLDQYRSLFKKLPNFDRIAVALQSIAVAMRVSDTALLDEQTSKKLVKTVKALIETMENWTQKAMIEKHMDDVHLDDQQIMNKAQEVEAIFK